MRDGVRVQSAQHSKRRKPSFGEKCDAEKKHARRETDHRRSICPRCCSGVDGWGGHSEERRAGRQGDEGSTRILRGLTKLADANIEHRYEEDSKPNISRLILSDVEWRSCSTGNA